MNTFSPLSPIQIRYALQDAEEQLPCIKLVLNRDKVHRLCKALIQTEEDRATMEGNYSAQSENLARAMVENERMSKLLDSREADLVALRAYKETAEETVKHMQKERETTKAKIEALEHTIKQTRESLEGASIAGARAAKERDEATESWKEARALMIEANRNYDKAKVQAMEKVREAEAVKEWGTEIAKDRDKAQAEAQALRTDLDLATRQKDANQRVLAQTTIHLTKTLLALVEMVIQRKQRGFCWWCWLKGKI